MYPFSLSFEGAPFTMRLGGFACAHPEAWSRHLLDQIRRLDPAYLHADSVGVGSEPRWKENACILESLDQYLFEEYGFSLPENNIFKVFNKNGEGIPPGLILEVVSNLIEPFGFEIEQVIVPDDELRREVGGQEYMVGAWGAPAFDGRAGICMINIREGYSHAFFWKRMESVKFRKSQFRMAILIKQVKGWTESRSARESIDIYIALLTEYLVYIGSDSRDPVRVNALNGEIRLLRRYMNNGRFRSSGTFRKTLATKLTSIYELLHEMDFYRDGSEEEIIRVVEKLVQRIVKEADEQILINF
jgi:hypothetical protein